MFPTLRGVYAITQRLLLTFLTLPALVAARPVEMKLLLLGGSGSEPSYLAAKSALDHFGTPYEAVRLTENPLPALDSDGIGRYQAILLATGNLAVCDPECRSALSPGDWQRLEAYAVDYAVRIVSLYTFPEPRYGLRYTDGLFSPLDAPSVAEFLPEAAAVFPNRRADAPVVIGGAYIYFSEPVAAEGETTVPVLRMGERVVGALHRKANGVESLALTFDHSPSLRHSLELMYGLVSWATKGVLAGVRRAYLSPQSDDLFLANNLFTSEPGPCSSTQFTVNPTQPLAPDCPKMRIGAQDLIRLREWQAAWNAEPQTSKLRITMAYNGLGAKPDAEDELSAEVRRSLGDFFWVNHTFSHKILDCYALDSSGACRPVTYDEGLNELRSNFEIAEQMGIPVDRPSLVTPAVSGLRVPDFLSAASAVGIQFLVSDTSRPEGNPTIPNTGITPETHPDLLFVPRRATNIFYNTSNPETGSVGSLTDEYNYFFGPEGIVRVGGQDGPPFFQANQTYEQIVEREANTLVTYMFRSEIYPSMFHQSNFFAYDGTHSLFTDTLDRTLRTFTAVSRLPVISLPQSEIGRLLEQRKAWLAAGARMILVPGESITITVEKPAVVPLTGVCVGTCEEYGSEKQSSVRVEPGDGLVISLRSE